ncbi:hypothetical protein HanHA300_Chr13g0473551 [Helianthus annuus]|nr:hypothetical protein HanHA300_Chr13g0473551 [Helianthus annuus]KAJ0496924.1 hypothetical protein HanHA89_Chr13g0505441 [Helianthus annuus]KAJ0662957.1 hypothetical protein HanLR1_Chr13g0475611 [Helianthus annuus]
MHSFGTGRGFNGFSVRHSRLSPWAGKKAFQAIVQVAISSSGKLAAQTKRVAAVRSTRTSNETGFRRRIYPCIAPNKTGCLVVGSPSSRRNRVVVVVGSYISQTQTRNSAQTHVIGRRGVA